MASRLFHTVVAVGIAISAASVGCAEATEQTSHDESALTNPNADSKPAAPAAATPSTPPAADCPDAGPGWESFCDAAWPTTKGGAWSAPDCIDPQNKCERSQAFRCFKQVGTEGACVGGPFNATVSVCKDQEWQCKPGRAAWQDCKCFVLEGQTTCPPPAPPGN